MAYQTKTDGEKHFPITSADGINAVSYVYQPVICAATQEILYFEQLARFAGADDDQRRTQTIIEWLEVTGDIIALDIHSFDVAIVALLENRDINIGVNISGATLSKKDACAEIVARLKDAAEICPRLYVEVTETHAISNMLYAAEFASALDGLGMQMVVDDFGEGNSTALYLSVLYPALVKLQIKSGQAVTAELLEKAALARTYGAALVVEGLESQADILRFPKTMVDFYQGHHVGRPAGLHQWRLRKSRPALRLVSNA